MQPPEPTSSIPPVTVPVSTPIDSEAMQKIQKLLAESGSDPLSPESNLISQMIYTSLKMANAGFDMGQLKLMARSLKEMKYAYRIFNEHRIGRCVSIFGSARTPEEHPDYQAAKAFSTAITAKGWVCMTGAAYGIMKAGLEGTQNNSGFGLSIRLPFEETPHTLLAGDPKLINFRYFFTRKLMFLSHSDAVVAFPGGVGTLDELFEVLTLMQTGRTNIVPVVLLEGTKGQYWSAWEDYIQNQLLANGWISQEDQHFYHYASDIQEAVDHIQQFYRRYHSSRYVKDTLIIRLLTPLTEAQIDLLNEEFKILIKEGKIYATSALSDEHDHLDLPRLAFEHNRKYFGSLRAMIDRINAF